MPCLLQVTNPYGPEAAEALRYRGTSMTVHDRKNVCRVLGVRASAGADRHKVGVFHRRAPTLCACYRCFYPSTPWNGRPFKLDGDGVDHSPPGFWGRKGRARDGGANRAPCLGA